MCEWFVDNKLSIYFGENKTKCFVFDREKNLSDLNITFNNIRVKQCYWVKCLDGYCLDTNLNGEYMAKIFLKKINTELTVLTSTKWVSKSEIMWLLCNTLIQLHFDYACITWYPLVIQKIKKYKLLKINEYDLV